MDSIVLRVPELKRLAALLSKDKVDYVQVMLLEDDASSGVPLPPSATFTGLRAACPWELLDYGEMEVIPVEEADFSILGG